VTRTCAGVYWGCTTARKRRGKSLLGRQMARQNYKIGAGRIDFPLTEYEGRRRWHKATSVEKQHRKVQGGAKMILPKHLIERCPGGNRINHLFQERGKIRRLQGKWGHNRKEGGVPNSSRWDDGVQAVSHPPLGSPRAKH